ncbi:hypothetical protein CANINC_000635 [Pichia inconspicua]|uniref:Uncharacterized protein n=1 Tax=Pichia inconspicua TaxID=52247 RepID=A0A4T0X5K3_9ASCO|nr:hypothetical protein CANINC_000635 [[Candida] inconspicua]
MSTIRGIDSLFDEIPNSQRKSGNDRPNSNIKNSNTNTYSHSNNSNNSDYEAIDLEFQPVRTIPTSIKTKLRVERALTQSNPNPEPFYHSQTTQSITSSSQSQSQQSKSNTQSQGRNSNRINRPHLPSGVTQSQSFIQSQISPETQRHRKNDKRDIRKSSVDENKKEYDGKENFDESDESDYDVHNTSYTLNPKGNTRSTINWNKLGNKETVFTTENLTANLDLGDFDLDNVIDEPTYNSDDESEKSLVRKQQKAIEENSVHKIKLSPLNSKSDQSINIKPKVPNTKSRTRKKIDDSTHVVLAPRRFKTKRPQRIEAGADDKAKKLEILRKKKEEAEQLLAEIKRLEESSIIDDDGGLENESESPKSKSQKEQHVQNTSADIYSSESDGDTINGIDQMLDNLEKVVTEAQESQLPQKSNLPNSHNKVESKRGNDADVIDFLPELPEAEFSEEESDIEIVEEGTEISRSTKFQNKKSDESDTDDEVIQPKLLAQPTVTHSNHDYAPTNDSQFLEEELKIQEYYHRLNDANNENAPASPPPTEIDNSSSRLQDKLITQELKELQESTGTKLSQTQSLFVHDDDSDEDDFFDAKEPDEIKESSGDHRLNEISDEEEESIILPVKRVKKDNNKTKEERLRQRAESLKSKSNDYTPYSESSSDESSDVIDDEYHRSTQTFVDDNIQYESDVQSLDELEEYERKLEESSRKNPLGKQKSSPKADQQVVVNTENYRKRKRRNMSDPSTILKELEFSNPGKKVALPDISLEGSRSKRSENVSYTESPPDSPVKKNIFDEKGAFYDKSKETDKMMKNIRNRRPLPELHFDENNLQHEKLKKNLQISNAGAKANIPEILVIHETDSESEVENDNPDTIESVAPKTHKVEKTKGQHNSKHAAASELKKTEAKVVSNVGKKIATPHTFEELLHLTSLKKQKEEKKKSFQKSLKDSKVEVISLSDEDEGTAEKATDGGENEEEDEIVITNVVKTNRKNRSREERIKRAREKRLKRIQAAAQAIDRFNRKNK